MLPTISLVVTVYNRERFLAATLDSIVAQTYRNFELVVWDDGSTDQSLKIARYYAERDARIQVVSASHQGLSHTLRSAIAATTAPLLGWVDSDDLIAPTALEETVAVLAEHPQVGMVYTNFEVIDAKGTNYGIGASCDVAYSPEQLLVDFMTFHFRLMRRSCYEQVGGIDVTYPMAEDYDLCLKLSEVTQILHLPRSLYYYRRHSANTTSQPLELIPWTQRVIEAAMRRRGLAERYRLHTSLTSYFSLRSREDTKSEASGINRLIFAAPPTLPLVSIIIPCYNAAPRLTQCLQSCLNQTYPSVEIIVVDNNSTDASMSIAKQWAAQSQRPISIHRCRVQHANAARNSGFERAHGQYIQWLDADDELAPDKIARQVKALEQQPHFDIAFGDWQWQIQLGEPPTELQFVEKQYEDMLLQLLLDNWRVPHSYLLRYAAAERLHRFEAWNPTTSICMDREYFTLAALLGLRFLYVPNAVAQYYTWAETQLTRTCSYRDRVVSRCKMFQRFRDVAALRPEMQSNAMHQFLLQQAWATWIPNFTLHEATTQSYIEQFDTGKQLALSPHHVRMIRSLLNAPFAQTLEDYARLIIRDGWSVLLIKHSTSNAGVDLQQMSQQLMAYLGLLQSEQYQQFVEPSLVSSALQLDLPIAHEIPLLTPLFADYRLAVHGFLDALRKHDWLKFES